MKKYPLSLAPDYCPDWSVEDAIREILQNCLDSPELFEFRYDQGHLELTNLNTTLHQSTLLLGTSSKRSETSSVGGYGEGFKIALLILCREGLEVEIQNGDKRWLPFYEYSELFDSKALVIYEEELHNGNQDLIFSIKGVEQDVFETIVERCLHVQEDIGEVIETEDGRILKDRAGKLFVGGLYVSDINTEYGYDFNPDKLSLNRDRKTVNGFDLQWATSRMWALANDPDMVAELIHNNKSDVYYADSHKTVDIKDACFSLYKEKYEGKVLAENYYDQTQLEEKGIEDVIVLSPNFVKIVTSHSEYEVPEEVYEEEQTPLELLEELQTLVGDGDKEIKEKFQEVVDKFESKGVSWDS